MFKEFLKESSNTSIKELKKRLKKDGYVMIINSDDIVISVDEIDGDTAYGMDQWDNDVEIDLKKDKYSIDEKNNV